MNFWAIVATLAAALLPFSSRKIEGFVEGVQKVTKLYLKEYFYTLMQMLIKYSISLEIEL